MKTTECKCGSSRILEVCAKCSDLCSWRTAGGEWQEGYVPTGKGIGEDMDYVEIAFCMDCGQIQGKFPLPKGRRRK